MYQEYLLERVPILAQQAYENVEAPASVRFANAFDMSATRENPMVSLYDMAKFHYYDDENFIDKETWDRDYARPDTEWYDGMTTYQAEVIRDEWDYNYRYEMMADATDEMNVAGIFGYLGGALTDPLNYLPWTRLLGASAKMIGKAAVISAKTGKNTNEIIDAVLGAMLGETALYQKKQLYQDEYDLATAYFNVLSAGAIGAGIAGMRKVSSNLKNKSTDENMVSASKALQDKAEGRSPEVDGGNPPKQKSSGELERESPLDEFENIVDRETKLMLENDTIKRVFDQSKSAWKSMTDFISCRMT